MNELSLDTKHPNELQALWLQTCTVEEYIKELMVKFSVSDFIPAMGQALIQIDRLKRQIDDAHTKQTGENLFPFMPNKMIVEIK